MHDFLCLASEGFSIPVPVLNQYFIGINEELAGQAALSS